MMSVSEWLESQIGKDLINVVAEFKKRYNLNNQQAYMRLKQEGYIL